MNVNRRRALLMAVLLLAAPLLQSCTDAAPAPSVPGLSLPAPAESPYAPPVGDTGLNQRVTTALYLPTHDGQQLLAVYEELELSLSVHPAETVVRALLNHPGNDRVRSIAAGLPLTLQGANPVEVSGTVCTVNLGPSVMGLSMQDVHTVCLSIAATLCALDGVESVNVLSADQAIAMDVAGNLPLGVLSPGPVRDLPLLYEQWTARRTPVGSDPASTPLTAAAALYHPLADGTGVAQEVRRLSFPGQSPRQLVSGLLEALAAGPAELEGAAPAPDWPALLLAEPEVTQLSNGGRRVTLRLAADARSRMADTGADPACCFASLVYTLTSFVPSLQQVCILLGDNGALTSLYSQHHGSLLFEGALHTRRDYAGWVRAQATVYLMDNGKLAARHITLPCRVAQSPRTLLLAMAESDAASAVLPAGLTDADIIGLAITGDTLLIHLSARSADLIRDSRMDQRLMALSIAGTMHRSLGVRRVRFYFGSQEVADLGSDVIWRGDFLYNPGVTP